MLRRLLPLLAVLVVTVSGAWATLAGVLAYESHIVNVEASVANALNVPDVFNLGGESFSTSTPQNVLFPQQFIVGSVSFGLSEEFKANPNVEGLTVDVYVHCKQDPEFLSSGGQWMGDATYMSTGPTGDPGPNDGTTAPPTTDLAQANNGWIFVGGDPSACSTDAGGSPANLLKVFSSGTAIILDKSNLPASGLGSVHLGLDVPICEFNYNEATSPKPTEAGCSKPTLVIGSADPRFPDDGAGNVIDPDCNQRLGLDVKIQVVAIGATGIGGSPPGGPLAQGKMYWTDSSFDTIQRANLDGTGVEGLFPVGGLDAPHGIALDIAGGKMYWTDDLVGTILRANLDGTGVEDLFPDGLEVPQGIALDIADGKIYWADDGLGTIQRADLNGTVEARALSLETLVEGLAFPHGIALDIAGGKMYWAGTDAFGDGTIQRTDLTPGTNVNFSAATLSPSLEDFDVAYTIAGGKIRKTTFNNNSDRHYVRTVATDYNTVDFVAELTFTLTDLPGGAFAIHYFGLGSGDPDPTFFNESTGVYFRIHSSDQAGGQVDAVAKPPDGGFSPLGTFGIGNITSTGATHRARITKIGNQVKFDIDVDFTGTFVSDMSSQITDLAAAVPFLNDTNSRIYFGTASAIDTFDDLTITVVETLFTDEVPLGIALDIAGGKMYWTDDGIGTIQRANLDGTGVEDLFPVGGLVAPHGIALDIAAGKMYWTDEDAVGDGTILRADLDGTNVEVLFGGGLDAPHGIALD